MDARRSLLGLLLMTVTALGWAGAWLTAKLAAHDAPPLTVTTGRFAAAALALLPVWLVLERGRAVRPTPREWGLLGAMALTGAVGYTVLFLLGVAYAPASDGAVLTPGLSGVFAIVISAVLLRKAPAPRAILGAALALGGCVLVGWSAFVAGEQDAGRRVGDGLFVLSAVVWGAYTVLGKRVADRVPPVTSILLVATLGAVGLAPVALLVDGVPDLASWSRAAVVNVLYLGLGATAVAFVTYYSAVRLVGVERVAPALGLVPVFAVLGATLLLGEALTLLHAAGGALVVAGIVLPAARMRRGGA